MRGFVAQQAEPRTRHRAQCIVAALGHDQVVGARAEEGEVPVGHPLQESKALGEFVGVECGRRPADILHDMSEAGKHLQPVVRGRAHVVQHAFEILPEPVERRRIGLPVDLDVEERLERATGRVRTCETEQLAARVAMHPQDRMYDEVESEVVAFELHRHRVDEERHVVVDDLHDGVA